MSFRFNCLSAILSIHQLFLKLNNIEHKYRFPCLQLSPVLPGSIFIPTSPWKHMIFLACFNSYYPRGGLYETERWCDTAVRIQTPESRESRIGLLSRVNNSSHFAWNLASFSTESSPAGGNLQFLGKPGWLVILVPASSSSCSVFLGNIFCFSDTWFSYL